MPNKGLRGISNGNDHCGPLQACGDLYSGLGIHLWKTLEPEMVAQLEVLWSG